MWWCVAYAASVCVFWGVFIAVDNTREARGLTFLMALVWPVILLAAIGYAMSKSGEGK